MTQIVFDHPQLPFRLADNTHTTVDEGLYEFLMLMRDLGVKTQFSCQGNEQFAAYVTADADSFGPLIQKLLAMKTESGVLTRIFNKAPVRYYESGINRRVFDEHGNHNHRWEFDKHPEFGDRYTLRWAPSGTREFTDVLERLNIEQSSRLTTQLKEHFNG